MKVSATLNLYQADTEHICIKYNKILEKLSFFLHLHVSFRLESYVTEAFEIDILFLSSFSSLFFFPYFYFATSRYTIPLGCCFYFARKQGVFQPSLPLPPLLISTYPLTFQRFFLVATNGTLELCMAGGKSSTVSRCC